MLRILNTCSFNAVCALIFLLQSTCSLVNSAAVTAEKNTLTSTHDNTPPFQKKLKSNYTFFMRVYQGLLLFLSLSSLIMISLSLIFKVFFFFLRSGSWGGLHHPCCFSTSWPYSAPFGQVIACVPECLQGCLLWGRGVVEGHFAACTLQSVSVS